jgi:hypothetical protein
MSKKKTIEQLELEAKRAEQRAKDLRLKAKKQTQLEEAKLNVEIIKAVEYWNSTRQVPFEKKDIPSRFYEWAEKNKIKNNND